MRIKNKLVIKHYFSLFLIRRTQRPTTKSTPDKQKNGTDTGLKYSVLKYTIEPLSNKKHEQIIKEIKIKLRFVINYESSLYI